MVWDSKELVAQI